MERLLKQAFLSRRKMLRNSLGSVAEPSVLEALASAAGIGLEQRPQEVPPQAWVAMAKGLNRID